MSSRRRGIEAQADDPWLQHGLDYGDNRRVPLASVSVLSINQSVSRLQPVLLPCPLAPARLRLIKTGHRSFGTGDAVYGSLSACAPVHRANGDNLSPVLDILVGNAWVHISVDSVRSTRREVAIIAHTVLMSGSTWLETRMRQQSPLSGPVRLS